MFISYMFIPMQQDIAQDIDRLINHQEQAMQRNPTKIRAQNTVRGVVKEDNKDWESKD